MKCVIDKLKGCDEATADELTNSEYENMKESYRTMCLPCNPEAAKDCGSPGLNDDTETICKYVHTSFPPCFARIEPVNNLFLLFVILLVY